MPTEDDLRELFARSDRRTDAPAHHLDAKRVIRASRARRLPKQLAAGSAGALVLAFVTVLGVQSLTPGGGVNTANAPVSNESSDQDSGGATEDATFSSKRAPADKLNLCGGTVTDVAPSQFGLVLDVVFPAEAPASAARIDGIVIMTNTGVEPVTGTTLTSPAMTLSQDGVVVWHTNGPADLVATVVDLAPGASMEFPASFVPVRCATEDDTLEAFRADLPATGPGAYELSAALDFNPDIPTPTSELDLVTGPRTLITLN